MSSDIFPAISPHISPSQFLPCQLSVIAHGLLVKFENLYNKSACDDDDDDDDNDDQK